MSEIYNRVKVKASGTPGTGTITLGTPVSGFQTFAQANAVTGSTVSYLIEEGTSWEIGIGTYTNSGGVETLSRDTVYDSSNSGSKISVTSSGIIISTPSKEYYDSFGYSGYEADGSIPTHVGLNAATHPIRVHRFRDRALFGNAVEYTGKFASAGDVGTSNLSTHGASYFLTNSVLGVGGVQGRYGLVAYGFGSPDTPPTGGLATDSINDTGGIGLIGVGVLKEGAAAYSRGAYFEGINNSNAGWTAAFEAHAVNATSIDYVPSAYGYRTTTKSVSNATGTGTVITITHAGSHTYKVGSRIIVTGITPSGYNTSSGGAIVTASTSNTVSFAGSETGVYSSGGSCVDYPTPNFVAQFGVENGRNYQRGSSNYTLERQITNITGTGAEVTVTHAAHLGGYVFPVGETICIEGVTPSVYNGYWTVTASTSTTTKFASALTTAYTSGGEIARKTHISTFFDFSGGSRSAQYQKSRVIFNFRNGAFYRDGALGATGIGHIFNAPQNTQLTWDIDMNNRGSWLRSSAATAGSATGIDMQDNTIVFGRNNYSAPESMLQVRGVASPVNYLITSNAATGGPVYLQATGTDTNVNLAFYTKGTAAQFTFRGNNGSEEYLRVTGAASSVNYLHITAAATGNHVDITAAGSDTNIPLDIQSKGASPVRAMAHGGTVEVARFQPNTSNAVNGFEFRSFATGSRPQINAYGSDVNIGIDYVAKGSGIHNFNANLSISGTQVVGTRVTGWGTMTGTATRTAFDTATVTTSQLAERVKALTDDLRTHGLIGT